MRAMTLAKCDVIRAGARAAMRAGACAGPNPPGECSVTDLATRRDIYTQTKYAPENLLTAGARLVREKELSVLRRGIEDDAAKVRAALGPGAPTDVSWGDFTACLWNASGAPGGGRLAKYFGRQDLEAMGYQPRPALGGSALEGRLPAAVTDRVPVGLDRALNPDLAVVVVLAFLLAVFGGLLWRAHAVAKKLAGQAAAQPAKQQAKAGAAPATRSPSASRPINTNRAGAP